MAEDAGNIVAKDLMLRVFSAIGAGQTLREAMQALVALQGDPQSANALVILDADGKYEGLLTSRLLFKSLLTLWMPARSVREDEALLQRELLDVVQDRSQTKVHDALIRGLPTVGPEERLLRLMELGSEGRLEFIPVLCDGRVLGLVPLSEIFRAAASIALTPEHEGIRMKGEPPE